MKRNRKNAFISITLGMLLVFSTFAVTFAGTDETTQVATGEENTDAIADQIIDEGDYTVEQEDEIADDVDNLDSLGIPVDNINDVSEEDGDMVYSVKMTNSVTDEINIDEQNNGDIIMSIDEGSEIHDDIIITNTGEIYINNKKVEYSSEVEDDLSSNVTASNWAGKWSTSCPKKFKTYNSLKLARSCGNIALKSAVGSLSVGALTTVLGAAPGMAPLALCYTIAANLKGAHGVYTAIKSKHLSYKIYQANSKPYGAVKRVAYYYGNTNYRAFNSKTTTYGYVTYF